jgi:dTDP-4-amino-4,6-dideoxygalactose transaminase
LHHSFGTNWRMTEMQAALGRIGLRKLPSWLGVRRRYAAVLNEAFRGLRGLRVAVPPAEIAHAYYKYYTFVEAPALRRGMTRDRIMTAINSAGIPCFSGSCSEIYREQAFVDAGLTPSRRLPVARALGETSLMFLVHPTLTEDHISRTCEVVEAVMAAAIPRQSRRLG